MFKIDESRITLAKALEDLSHNEWAVADWRDNAVVNVDCEDAFKSILPVLELALEQADCPFIVSLFNRLSTDITRRGLSEYCAQNNDYNYSDKPFHFSPSVCGLLSITPQTPTW